MYSYYIHTLYCVYILYDLFYKGGVYYIDFFPKKYQKNLAALDKYGDKHDYLDLRRVFEVDKNKFT